MDCLVLENKVTGSRLLNPTLTGYKILVVDDDPDMRELLVILLKVHGAEILSAGSVKEFFSLLESESPNSLPDLIISDISMPNEDGYALIEKLRKMKSEKGGKIPAIALTALTSEQARSKALALGFQAYIRKPFEPKDIISTIQQISRCVL